MFFLLSTEGSLVNKKPSTLVGPTVTKLVQDPLAVLLLDNRLCIYQGHKFIDIKPLQFTIQE